MTAVKFYQKARFNVGASTGGVGQINLANSAAGAFRCMFVNAYTFDATHSAKAQVSADQIAQDNYTEGGIGLTSISYAVATSGTATWDADNVAVTASGGDIVADGAVIWYPSAPSGTPLVCYIDFEGTVTAADGNPLEVQWDADGILQIK